MDEAAETGAERRGSGGLPPPPDEGGLWQIWAMRYGSGRTRRVHDNFMVRDMHDGPMPLDYYLWILRSRERTVLVDTGFGPRTVEIRARPIDIDPIEALARIGVDPDTLGDVILTHLHYDHASNIERLPAARLHVHADETAYATGPCMCHEIARRPYDVEDMVTLIRRLYAERVRFHEEGASPWPGITLREFPGHSAMVMGVEVATARGPVILASDAAHYYANILDRRPFVLTVDMTATLASYDRIEALAGDVAHLIPGHDPKVARIYPSRVVNGVELWALHEPPAAVDAAALADTSDY